MEIRVNPVIKDILEKAINLLASDNVYIRYEPWNTWWLDSSSGTNLQLSGKIIFEHCGESKKRQDAIEQIMVELKAAGLKNVILECLEPTFAISCGAIRFSIPDEFLEMVFKKAKEGS
jgi:hypothetical protein